MRTTLVSCVTSAFLGCSFGMPSAAKIRSSETPACSTSATRPWADTVAAGLIGLPLAIASSALMDSAASGPHDDVSLGQRQLGTLLATPAVVLLVVNGSAAGYGFSSVSACRLRLAEQREDEQASKQALDEERAPARTEAARARKARAWSMTLAAQSAARAHDCRTVRRLDLEVWGTDEDFHAAVFVRDVAIARCLARPSPARPGTP
jgi:hypothetical protein